MPRPHYDVRGTHRERLYKQYGRSSEHKCGECSLYWFTYEKSKHGYCDLIGQPKWKADWDGCNKGEWK